jgi:hypothetical protein
MAAVAGWPGAPIPVPGCIRGAVVELREDDRLHIPIDPERRTAPVAEELAIRRLPGLAWWERDIVVDFLANNGALNGRGSTTGLIFKMANEGSIYRDDRRMHWVDAALHLGEARALAEHLLATRSGGDTCAPWNALHEAALSLPSKVRGASVAHDAEQATALFVIQLNNGLRAFSPRIEFTWTPDVEATYSTHVGRPEFDLFECLCAQLHNTWVDVDVPVRTCPHCGIAFQRQQGRAQQRQNRVTGGVEYCSPNCAKNAWAKRVRIRKKKGIRP